jgi:hypothetical protein
VTVIEPAAVSAHDARHRAANGCGCEPDAGVVCARHCSGCAWPEPTAATHTYDCVAGARSLEASRDAAARVTFELTYARSPVPRRFAAGLMTGPDLPCAYGSEVRASGDWEDGQDASAAVSDRGQDDWIDRYANYAVNEAVHEALEWLRVDGQPWLDPHGEAEEAIHALTNELCEQLAALRRAHLPDRSAADHHGAPAHPAIPSTTRPTAEDRR